MAIVKKISELTPKGSALANTDLLIVGVDNGTDYDLKSVTGAQVLGNVVSQTITDGVTTKAPSENAVFDGLALKANKTELDGYVKTTTNQTIGGEKTFTSNTVHDLALRIKHGTSSSSIGYTGIGANVNQLIVGIVGATQTLTFPNIANYIYTYPSATGTLALTTDIDTKVPYTGATQNVDLGEFELKAGQLSLDITPTGTAAVGTTRWNDSLGTSETTLKGGSVIIKNGVDLVARVVNKVIPNTTLTKNNYQVVRISGAQGQRLAVNLAQANNDNNSADTLGIVCETIATNEEGFIMTMGQLENVNTTGSLQSETWVDGDVLYLSPTTAGKITNIKPTGATGHIVILGYVEYAHAVNGKIYVKIMNGWELDELHNVSISGVLDKQLLSYDNATSLWKNKSVTTDDIADSLNKRYVTDANLTTIGNTSGTNTGDETVSTIKTKLGITTLSGSNTGDQDLSGLMVKSNNLSDLTNTTTARTNLGLGSLATQNGTFSGTSSGTNTGDQIISDATLTTTDITTNNVSITKHGFVPKAPNNTTQFLRGDGTWGTPASGGLTYFTEAQSTTSPNATVNVDSLTAVASTTNADFVIRPKGTGAILGNIPDNTATGGNKRGANAVDLQTIRNSATDVANGDYSVISGGYRNKASGLYSVVNGGYISSATGESSTNLGGYASNATGYSALTFGYQCQSNGVASIALGATCVVAGNYSIAMGNSNNLSGRGSIALGESITMTELWNFASGYGHSVNGRYSNISGVNGSDNGVWGRQVFSVNNTVIGDAQKSTFVLSKRTTDATSTVLTIQGGSVNSSTQLTLANNNSIRFKGTIIGRQSGSTNTSAWDIDGIIQRGTSAGTTTLLISNVNVVQNTPAWGTPTLTANTTLGCLTVTVIGASANIQWTCVIDTTEVIYA